MATVPPTNLPLYLKPSEVAELLCVHPRTVSGWALKGKIRSCRTPGGHRRIPMDVVDALREGRIEDAAPLPLGIPAQRTSSGS